MAFQRELGLVLETESGKAKDADDPRLRAALRDDMEHRIKKAKAQGKKTIPLDKLVGQSYGSR